MAILDLRPNCECCDRDLPPESPDARMRTFECTFCRDCVDNVLGGTCPNCLGNLVARPIRPTAGPTGGLSTKRVVKSEGCARPGERVGRLRLTAEDSLSPAGGCG